MRYLRSSFLIVLPLAGCVPPPAAPEAPPAPVVTPAPRPTLPPSPPPAPLASDWNDWPYTPGRWHYMGPGAEPYATFGTDQSVVQLICQRADRQIILRLVVGANANFVVRTTTLTRELPTDGMGRSRPGEPIAVSARLSPNDPLLDAIAFSRGRFVIEQPGQPPLVLPPQAEIGRVIEDCRG